MYADGHGIISSYDIRKLDVSYRDVVKINISELFNAKLDSKHASYGIKGRVKNPGKPDAGWMDLKIYAFDQNLGKHIIYHVRLDHDSPDHFSTGTPQTEHIELFDKKKSFKGTEIKELLQSIEHSFTLNKEGFLRHVRESATLRQNEKVISKSTVAGAIIGGALGIGIGTLTAPATAGASFVAMPLIGASIGASIGKGIDLTNNTPTLLDDYVIYTGLDKANIDDLNKNSRIVPVGMYPVLVVLEMKDAWFYGARVPGIPDDALDVDAFLTLSKNPDASQTEHDLTSTFWHKDPGVLDELDKEIISVSEIQSALTSSDYKHPPRVKLTVNPGTPVQASYTYEPGGHIASPPTFIMGDHILLEVIVPTSGKPFQPSNPQHYPKLSGFPFAWLAYFGGEALYQCEPSIQPGEWRPWLGYDSQVHGAAIRSYPKDFDPKFNPWVVDLTSHPKKHVVFRWSAKLTRRMDSSKPAYHSVYTWPKQKTTPVTQRNNQKEGLNMELLRAWKDHTKATDSEPDFTDYNGNRILPGLDPDEFLFLRDSHRKITDSITLSGEPWKTVPDDEAANPLNDIVTAYKKNRTWHVDRLDYRAAYGANYAAANYEIQDLGTSPKAPDGNATGNNTAPGAFTVILPSFVHGEKKIPIKLNVKAPLEHDKGYYGNIEAKIHPASWERGLSYTVTGLHGAEIDRYAVSFIYEDSLGIRRYSSYFLSNEPKKVKQDAIRKGKWLITIPGLLGYGYYTINLWHKNPRYKDSWTRIGGKELLDINLRFLSVPGRTIGGERYPGGADLKESPGDGAYIYVDDYRDKKSDGFMKSKLHRYWRNYVRTYVFETYETSTFEILDADPHTFTHRGTEWYLSARTQAKRITDAELEDRIRFYVDPVDEHGNVEEDYIIEGTGKKFTKSWHYAGTYQLKAVYNGTSSISHRIVVVDPGKRNSTSDKGDISYRKLHYQEIDWLKYNKVDLGSGSKNEIRNRWLLFSIDNINSLYRYRTGPRVNTGNQVNRFHPGNDYADSYRWNFYYLKNSGDETNASHRDVAPHGLKELLADKRSALDGVAWFPRNLVRHTSEKNAQGIPMPNDLSKKKISHFSSLSQDQKKRIINLFTKDLPEPWQVRLPWISFVKDPSPWKDHADTWHYRTRTNIKVIYDMNAFFDNNHGAFSGNPPDITGGDDSYENLLKRGIYLNLMSDEIKNRRSFFQKLLKARYIIAPSNSINGGYQGVQVYNLKDSDTIIAERLFH